MGACLRTVAGVASLLLVVAVEGQVEIQPLPDLVQDNAQRIEALEKQLSELAASVDLRTGEELDQQVGVVVEARLRELAAVQSENFATCRKDLDERYGTTMAHVDEIKLVQARLKAEIEVAHTGIQTLRVAISSYPELEGKEEEQDLGQHDSCYLTSVKIHSKLPIRSPDCSVYRREKGWVLEAHSAACTATCLDLVLPESAPGNLLE